MEPTPLEVSIAQAARDFVKDPNASIRYMQAVERDVELAVAAVQQKIKEQVEHESR
jgi:hypothetical protein